MDAEMPIPLMDTPMHSSRAGHYGWALEKQDFNFPRCVRLGGWRTPSHLSAGVTLGLLQVVLLGDPAPTGELRCCHGCAQDGMMVNSPSPKGKAFLLGWSHSLGVGGGKSVLAVPKWEQGAC